MNPRLSKPSENSDPSRGVCDTKNPPKTGCVRKSLIKNVNRYEILKKIGQGTYGEVFKARHRRSKKIVALKRLRLENESEGFPITALREVKLLQMLDFEHIVNLIEVCCSSPFAKNTPFSRDYFLVLDFAYHDLAGLLSNVRISFELSDIKSILKQFFTAIFYLHDCGILHRDLKGANILFTKTGILKLADFGLSRVLSPSDGSKVACYTPTVVTLWYRSPEILLGERRYGPSLDMWSAGCIMAELWLRHPLLKGASEQQQMYAIIDSCGSISADIWPGVSKLPLFEKLVLTTGVPRRLKDKLRARVSDVHALELIDRLLMLDPSKRPSAEACLMSDFFFEDPLPGDLSKLFQTLDGNYFDYTTSKPARQSVNHFDNRLRALITDTLSENVVDIAAVEKVFRDVPEAPPQELHSHKLNRERGP